MSATRRFPFDELVFLAAGAVVGAGTSSSLVVDLRAGLPLNAILGSRAEIAIGLLCGAVLAIAVRWSLHSRLADWLGVGRPSRRGVSLILGVALTVSLLVLQMMVPEVAVGAGRVVMAVAGGLGWGGVIVVWRLLGARNGPVAWAGTVLVLGLPGLLVALSVQEGALGEFRFFIGDIDRLLMMGAVGFAVLLLAVRALQPRVARGVACGVLVVVMGWTLAPRSWLASGPAPSADNVLMIIIDTLRFDRTSLEPRSDGRDTTPNLRRLAQRGTLYTRAISQAPWTLPAVSTILTGMYPAEHGATSMRRRLGASATTLAELFREAGYATLGVVSHTYVDAKRGIGQGFDVFDESNVKGDEAVTSDGVTDKLLDVIGESSGEPFFALAHYFDPHYSYVDHDDWTWADSRGTWLRDEDHRITSLRQLAPRFERAEIDYLLDLYDEEIAFTDRAIGRLLDELEARGLGDRTHVIVVADHGEEFLERGWLGHTVSLHREQIHVPMIVSSPGRGPRVDPDTIETRALFNITRALAGLIADEPAPVGGQAFSEVSLLELDESDPRRVYQSALRTDGWLMTTDHEAGTWDLFDLNVDPGEFSPMFSADESPVWDTLYERLDEWSEAQAIVAGAQGHSVSSLSSEDLDRLRAMGYIR